MVTLEYRATQFISVEIENLTKEDIEEMSKEELMGIIEEIYTFGNEDGKYDCALNDHNRAELEVYDEEDELIVEVSEDYD